VVPLAFRLSQNRSDNPYALPWQGVDGIGKSSAAAMLSYPSNDAKVRQWSQSRMLLLLLLLSKLVAS
jgi:hypothetical protein